jgi:hypothetical protein
MLTSLSPNGLRRRYSPPPIGAKLSSSYPQVK